MPLSSRPQAEGLTHYEGGHIGCSYVLVLEDAAQRGELPMSADRLGATAPIPTEAQDEQGRKGSRKHTRVLGRRVPPARRGRSCPHAARIPAGPRAR